MECSLSCHHPLPVTCLSTAMPDNLRGKGVEGGRERGGLMSGAELCRGGGLTSPPWVQDKLADFFIFFFFHSLLEEKTGVCRPVVDCVPV